MHRGENKHKNVVGALRSFQIICFLRNMGSKEGKMWKVWEEIRSYQIVIQESKEIDQVNRVLNGRQHLGFS